MRPSEGIFPLVLLAALMGCSSTTVRTTHDPLAVFPAEATWSWDEAANRLPRDERLRTLNLNSIIRDTASEAFAARGYVEAEAGAPGDYRLSFDVSVGRVISQRDTRGVGSVSLTLVESAFDHRVWVGFISADVDFSLPEAERRQRIAREMRRLLRDFPPGQ
jgi:hypothetical protein